MKTEHVVPLSAQALAVLHELRAIGCGSRYVFPGRNPDKPISNNTMLFALYRLGYKGKMTGHGFRTVASTILNEAGFRGDVIERQLAHCERNDVRGAYNRAEYLPESHRHRECSRRKMWSRNEPNRRRRIRGPLPDHSAIVPNKFAAPAACARRVRRPVGPAGAKRCPWEARVDPGETS